MQKEGCAGYDHHQACPRCRGEGVLLELSKRQIHERKRLRAEKLDREAHRKKSQVEAGDNKKEDVEVLDIPEASCAASKVKVKGATTVTAAEPHHELGEKRTTCATCSGTGLVFGSPPTAASGTGHVTIVGGGIGGVALGIALQQRGIRYTLFEKDDCFDSRRQGYGLTMQRYSGATALKQLGLMVPLGVGSDANVALDASGRVLGEYGHSVWVARGVKSENTDKLDNLEKSEIDGIDVAALKGLKGTGKHLPAVSHNLRNVHIPRQSLRKLLVDAIDPDSVKWSHSFESMKALSGGRVEVSFSNGENVNKVVTDCVVGADGIFSKVRAAKFDEDPVESLNFLGVICVLGICHGVKHELCENKAFQILDGTNRLFCMPFAPNDVATDILGYEPEIDEIDEMDPSKPKHAMMWQLSFPCDYETAQKLSRDREILLAESRSRVGGWCEPAATLLRITKEDNITGYPVVDRDLQSEEALRLGKSGGGSGRKGESNSECVTVFPSTPLPTNVTQASDKVLTTLIGDAAHPMSPFKGQGANQALCDAVGLARQLARAPLFSLGSSGQSGTPKLVSDTETALRIAEAQMLKRCHGKVNGSREASRPLWRKVTLFERTWQQLTLGWGDQVEFQYQSDVFVKAYGNIEIDMYVQM